MNIELKKLGNSTGIILPKELLTRLGLAVGDELVITETTDGFKVTRRSETFEKGMEIARKAMKTYHHTLKELAK
jgi:putative addiction module antidote